MRKDYLVSKCGDVECSGSLLLYAEGHGLSIQSIEAYKHGINTACVYISGYNF